MMSSVDELKTATSTGDTKFLCILPILGGPTSSKSVIKSNIYHSLHCNDMNIHKNMKIC